MLLRARACHLLKCASPHRSRPREYTAGRAFSCPPADSTHFSCVPAHNVQPRCKWLSHRPLDFVPCLDHSYSSNPSLTYNSISSPTPSSCCSFEPTHSAMSMSGPSPDPTDPPASPLPPSPPPVQEPPSPPTAVPHPYPYAFPIGVLSGSAGALFGIGGALVMVPLLVRVYSLRQAAANSTALLSNVATCVAGGAIFGAAGHVSLVAAACVALASALTAGAGARVAHGLPERTQKGLFGAAMMAMAPIIALRSTPDKSGQPEGTAAGPTATADADAGAGAGAGAGIGVGGGGGGADVSDAAELGVLGTLDLLDCAYLTGLGGAVGFSSGALGIGAGTMLTAGLACAGDMGHKTVLGTSFVAQTGASLAAAWAHYQLGNLQLGLVPWLMAGSCVGSLCVSVLSVGYVPEVVLRQTFAAFILFLGLRTMGTAWMMDAKPGEKSPSPKH